MERYPPDPRRTREEPQVVIRIPERLNGAIGCTVQRPVLAAEIALLTILRKCGIAKERLSDREGIKMT